MRPRRILTTIAPIALAAIALTGCAAGTSGAGTEPAVSEDTLVIYNAQHEQLTEEWVEAFTEETGIEVVLRNGNDSELGNQLVEEGEDSRADVFLTENSPAMSLVENAGLLAPVDQSTLDLGARRSTGRRAGCGRVSRPARRCSSTTPSSLDESELPASIMDLRTRVEGPLGRRTRRRGLPGDRLGDARARGRRRDGRSGSTA